MQADEAQQQQQQRVPGSDDAQCMTQQRTNRCTAYSIRSYTGWQLHAWHTQALQA
jgi:hypothetical protein